MWNGELIRESTKQTNKRVAEQMEAAHRTTLAKGEVGIREQKKVPTLEEFGKSDYIRGGYHGIRRDPPASGAASIKR